MPIDRREFLFSTVALPAIAAGATAPPTIVDRGFARVVRLVDSVYVTLADPARGPQCLSNGGVIVGRDATLIVEGHFQPEGAALEVDVARRVSPRPIRAAVDTHFHLDHTFGNCEYARQGIPILAHEQVRGLMQRDYGARQTADRTRGVPPADAAAPPPAADERTRLEGDRAADAWMDRAIANATLAYPTEVVTQAEGRRDLDLGGLVVVLECYQGHTPGDLVISVPSRDVAFVGDLLFHREYPVAIDADMTAWRAVLDRLVRRTRRLRLVPGHGPVSGRDDVRQQIDLMDDLRDHAERLHAAGVPIAEAIRRYVVPARFRGYEIFAWGWTIGAALRNHYARLAAAD